MRSFPVLKGVLIVTSTGLLLFLQATALVKKIPMKAIVGAGIVLVTSFVGMKFVQKELNELRKRAGDLNNVLDEFGADMKTELGGLRSDLKSELRAYRVERRQQVQEFCSEIKRNREEEQESLEILKKTAFLEGQMSAKGRWWSCLLSILPCLEFCKLSSK